MLYWVLGALIVGALLGLAWRPLVERVKAWRRAPTYQEGAYDTRIDQLAETARWRYKIHKAHHEPEFRRFLPDAVRREAARVLEWDDG